MPPFNQPLNISYPKFHIRWSDKPPIRLHNALCFSLLDRGQTPKSCSSILYSSIALSSCAACCTISFLYRPRLYAYPLTVYLPSDFQPAAPLDLYEYTVDLEKVSKELLKNYQPTGYRERMRSFRFDYSNQREPAFQFTRNL
jgi:hypothetical protein